MYNIKKLMLTLVVVGATAAGTGTANAFWGPFDWFDDGPGWGGPWGGYPRYGYGYPGYGYGYPGYGYGGYPGYGWGGYPGYGYGGYPGYGYGGYPGYGWGGYPGYGYGYAAPYTAPAAAAPAQAEKAE